MKKLLALLLCFAMVISMAGCGGDTGADNSRNDSTQPQQTVVEGDKDDSAVAPQQTPDEKPQDTPLPAADFDAQNAVTVEQLDDGVKYIFSTMPQTAEDIQALIAVYPVTDRHNTVAFFMASLVKYVEDEQEGLDMIDVLKGPQKLSSTEKSFIKERFSDKKYLPRAYFEGAAPENNYQPDEPWTVIIYDDPVAPPEGYTYTHVRTSGADGPRRVCLRLKGEENWLWEYNGVLMSIRLPANEDPWR